MLVVLELVEEAEEEVKFALVCRRQHEGAQAEGAHHEGEHVLVDLDGESGRQQRFDVGRRRLLVCVLRLAWGGCVNSSSSSSRNSVCCRRPDVGANERAEFVE